MNVCTATARFVFIRSILTSQTQVTQLRTVIIVAFHFACQASYWVCCLTYHLPPINWGDLCYLLGSVDVAALFPLRRIIPHQVWALGLDAPFATSLWGFGHCHLVEIREHSHPGRAGGVASPQQSWECWGRAVGRWSFKGYLGCCLCQFATVVLKNT